MAALLSQGIVQLQKSVISNSTNGATNQSAGNDEKIRKDVKMPQLVYTRHSATQMLSEDLSAWIYKVARWFSDYRRYCRSVSELSDLSAHELADLGLHRSEIKRVAHGTVYGQRP